MSRRISRAALASAVLTAAVVPCAFQRSVAQTPGAEAKSASLVIIPGQIVTPVSPMLYGIMTEEINHSYDGGLYAELVRNRTFRGSWEGVEGWGLIRRGDAQANMAEDKTDDPVAGKHDFQKDLVHSFHTSFL